MLIDINLNGLLQCMENYQIAKFKSVAIPTACLHEINNLHRSSGFIISVASASLDSAQISS